MAYIYWKTGWLTCWNRLTNFLTRYNRRTYTDNLLTRSYWNIKKLYDWLADTLEIADWVADVVKTGWLAGWQTENLLTRNGWHTEKRAEWHAGTGWITCQLTCYIPTTFWLGVTDINIKKLYDYWKWLTGLPTWSKLADWPADRLNTCWLAEWLAYWKAGWLTCWNWITNLLTC